MDENDSATIQEEVVLIPPTQPITGDTPMSECHLNRDDVARESSLERNALANAAQAERLSLENLNKIDGDTQNVDETVQRFGFANLNATSKEGSEGRRETENFGFQGIGATQRASDLGVSATHGVQSSVGEYGYRGVVATKDAEQEVLEAICSSSAGLSAAAREILMSQCGGFKDVLLQSAQNTASLQQSLCEDTKDILLQAAGNTASIKSESAGYFKDVLLQSAGNTAAVRSDIAGGVKDIQLQACGDTDAINSQSASQFKDVLMQNAAIAKDAAVAAAVNAAAVALQNTLNAKDAEIVAVGNAKDAALAAAVNFEKLYGQADRNTAALQASLAECCCEQKELTLATSHKTQDVVREVEDRRVRDELAKTREELIALRVRATLLPPLVGAAPL